MQTGNAKQDLSARRLRMPRLGFNAGVGRTGGIRMIRLLLLAVFAVAVAAGGLYYYGSTLKPQVTPVEKVIPNERFPK
jgi:hypothetical protein